MTIPAITLHQPWASLVACGAKRVETRSWATKYRGPIAIHAGMTHNKTAPLEWLRQGYNPLDCMVLSGKLPRGVVVAVARLNACIPTENIWSEADPRPPKGFLLLSLLERDLGDYSPGRYGWCLTDVKPLSEPIPCQGKQGLWRWTVPPELEGLFDAD